MVNETEEETRGQSAEGDEVNCVSTHCQTVDIGAENLSINLNYEADTLLCPFSFPHFAPFFTALCMGCVLQWL